MALSAQESTRSKVICFVTGAPGAGKTLLGLDLALKSRSGSRPAALLSGNRPLVHVLTEALAEDSSRRGQGSKAKVRYEAGAAIQNLLGYLKEHADGPEPPEHVIVFDEAQRAWDEEVGEKLMGRPTSEPALFLNILDRLDWACLVCLVGPGQEINRGEVSSRNGFHEPNRYKRLLDPRPEVYAAIPPTRHRVLDRSRTDRYLVKHPRREGKVGDLQINLYSAAGADSDNADDKAAQFAAHMNLPPPGDCTPGKHAALKADVDQACKSQPRACSVADNGATLDAKMDANALCIAARQRINATCFRGGDAGHKEQLQNAVNAQVNCQALRQKLAEKEKDNQFTFLGLTGAAAIGALILSEGSRTIPLRNLIPVP